MFDLARARSQRVNIEREGRARRRCPNGSEKDMWFPRAPGERTRRKGCSSARFARDCGGRRPKLIEALGKLSRSVRERAGESLKGISSRVRNSSALTTPFSRGAPQIRRGRDGRRTAENRATTTAGACALLQEAVTIDNIIRDGVAPKSVCFFPTTDANTFECTPPTTRPFAIATASRRWNAHLLTEGFYYTRAKRDRDSKAIAAYTAALVIDSQSTSALNNLAVVLDEKREYARSEDLYRRVTKPAAPYGGAFTNLMQTQIRLGHFWRARFGQRWFPRPVPQ